MNIEISFWCRGCRTDFDAEAVKSITHNGEEYFWSKCPLCYNKTVRYITEKFNDPYYRESIKVQIERDRFMKETLQPDEYKFRMYYEKEWKDIEKKKEMFEMKQKEEKVKRDTFYRNMQDKTLAKKALKLEEKLQYG